MSYVLRPSSTTCPNAAQKARLCNLKNLPNAKPSTHKIVAFYNTADPNANPTRATHYKGPSWKRFVRKWIRGSSQYHLGGDP